jgi:hypothetical protein
MRGIVAVRVVTELEGDGGAAVAATVAVATAAGRALEEAHAGVTWWSAPTRA